MADKQSSPLPASDYEAIENAVMETERGRWFLEQYRKRNRVADTKLLLKAIRGLKSSLEAKSKSDSSNSFKPNYDQSNSQLQLTMADMIQAIEQTKWEVAEINEATGSASQGHDATAELDAIVTQTEEATGEILAATEAILETSEALRDQGASEALCGILETRATDILMACSFQDLTGQRTQKVVRVLNYLETRIQTIMGIWKVQPGEAPEISPALHEGDMRPDAHLLTGPRIGGSDASQDDIDAFFVDGDPARISEENLTVAPEEGSVSSLESNETEDSHAAALEDISQPADPETEAVETEALETVEAEITEKALDEAFEVEMVESESAPIPSDSPQEAKDQAEDMSHDPTSRLTEGQKAALFG